MYGKTTKFLIATVWALALAHMRIEFAHGQQYNVIDLGTLGGANSEGHAVDLGGLVAGSSNPAGTTDNHACVYDSVVGSRIDLGTFGGPNSSSNGMNVAGLVVGEADTANKDALGNWIPHGFLYNYTTGVLTDIGTLGGTGSGANAVNASGLIVGWSLPTGLDIVHAFVYASGTRTYTDLGTLGGSESVALAINSSGQVAGFSNTPQDLEEHAFLYSGGIMRDLGTLGGSNSGATGVNDAGQVVGYADLPLATASHAFVWIAGVMKDLGTLGGPDSSAAAINSAGLIVGTSDTVTGAAHAFVYSGGQMIDLNSRIRPDLGWVLVEAYAINDYGQIVGVGTIGGSSHAFLLDPRPSSVVTVANVSGIITQTVTLRASLTRSSDNAPLTGRSLSFAVQGMSVGQATTDSAGVARLSFTLTEALGAGSKTVSGFFRGDSSSGSASGTGTLTVSKIPTAIQVDASAGKIGQTVSLSATVTRTTDNASLAGKMVTFKLDGSVLGTATVGDSGASFSYTIAEALGVGSHQVTVEYAGDSTYLAGSGSGTLIANQGDSSLTVENKLATIGQPVMLSAMLKATSRGSALSARTLTFQVDGATVGTALTDGTGFATLSYTASDRSGTGVKTILVTFPGDSLYTGSSGTGTLTVSAAETRTAVVNTAGGIGDTVILSATLTRSSDNALLDGRTLRFNVDGIQVGTGTTQGGVASVAYVIAEGTAIGGHTIAVEFAGDAAYTASSGTGTLMVTAAATSLVASDATGAVGDTVALTGALLRAGDGAALSGRTLVFSVDGIEVGRAMTDATGLATLLFSITPDLIVGPHTIQVDFQGETSYQPSTASAVLTVTM